MQAAPWAIPKSMMAGRCAALSVALSCLLPGIYGECRHSDLPDPMCTPGAHFKGDECGGQPCTARTLCRPGYSKIVRKVNESEKNAVYDAYGLPGHDHTGFCSGTEGCEIDHLISLEIGGSNDLHNLWPQPYAGTPWNARVKDTLENRLKKLFCMGAMELQDVQTCISTDWVACYRKYMGTDVPVESCGGNCDEAGLEEIEANAILTV